MPEAAVAAAAASAAAGSDDDDDDDDSVSILRPALSSAIPFASSAAATVAGSDVGDGIATTPAERGRADPTRDEAGVDTLEDADADGGSCTDGSPSPLLFASTSTLTEMEGALSGMPAGA